MEKWKSGRKKEWIDGIMGQPGNGCLPRGKSVRHISPPGKG
jgi:hypothetical protein